MDWIILNEPATWFAEPGSCGDYFELLGLALAQAVSLPRDQRHPRAKIVTTSGATFGWDEIDDIHRVFVVADLAKTYGLTTRPAGVRLH